MKSTFLPAVQGLGAVLLHMGEMALADPAVEAAIVTIIQQMLASRTAQP